MGAEASQEPKNYKSECRPRRGGDAVTVSPRRSAVYRRNSICPRTGPCGTPRSSVDGVKWTGILLSCRYEANQSNAVPVGLMSCGLEHGPLY